MRYEYINKQKTIIADTAEEYDAKMNEILNDHHEATIIDKEMPGKFCSVCRWSYSISICETAKEEFHERHEKYFCMECQFYVRPDKGNVKYTGCSHEDRRVRGDQECCDFFYEMLKAGTDLRLKI